MKITFLGAARTVTGSCYYIETENTKFLVDCGMFQGRSTEDSLNEGPFPFNPAELDFVILTHAHIDHSGRIPKIYVDGFKGQVFATKATVELCGIMLPDSGHIQEFENEWTNRKLMRAGKPPVEPLYTSKDATGCLKLFKCFNYFEIVKLSESIKIRFNDAGHILGSSIVEIWVMENKEEFKIVFSGDLGNKGMPILRDPSIIESADYLVIESTYGNRLHTESKNRVEHFVDIINETLDKGGNVVIPSFAIGRTQEIIYDLNKQHDLQSEKVTRLLNTPVIVDSPLAISATEVFRNNLDCYDDEAREYIKNGDNPLDFPGLQFTRTSEESKTINDRTDSAIIISASGMCDAGRIKHHLKHNLWRKDSTILFVGYQAEGTLGRKLVDGAKRVKIFGEEISVNARIEKIDGFSGHADRDALIEWINMIILKPKKIFVVHGEEAVMAEFSQSLIQKFNIETLMPSRGETYIVKAEGVNRSTDRYESAKPSYTYGRLELIDMMNKLKEEFDELTETIKNNFRQEKDEIEVEKVKIKLKAIERSVEDVLK